MPKFVPKNKFIYYAIEIVNSVCQPFLLNHIKSIEHVQCDFEYIEKSRFLVNFNQITRLFGGEVRERSVKLLKKWRKEFQKVEEEKLKTKLNQMFGSESEEDKDQTIVINNNTPEKQSLKKSNKIAMEDLFGSDSEEDDERPIILYNNIPEKTTLKNDVQSNKDAMKELFGSDSEEDDDSRNDSMTYSFGSDSDKKSNKSHDLISNSPKIKKRKYNSKLKERLRNLFGSDSEDEDTDEETKRKINYEKEPQKANTRPISVIQEINESYINHNRKSFLQDMNALLDRPKPFLDYSDRKRKTLQENISNKRRKI